VEAFADRLWVASEFLGDGTRAQPIPTARDQLGMEHPIGGSVLAAGQPAYLAFYISVEG
jgi:hypothetical protein